MAKSKKHLTPEEWWSTSIIEMEPGIIRYRGYAIEELIGAVGFAEMIWLLTRGELPQPAQAKLLESALVAAVDHGPQAPSIAIARMAITCGVDINNAMASAINVLGDVHGGAGEQCVAFYNAIAARLNGQRGAAKNRLAIEMAIETEIDRLAEKGIQHIPGFGHRFHPKDPRAPKLLKLVDDAARAGYVTGGFATIGRAVETLLAKRKGRQIPMNIDGATSVVFAELGFAPTLCRGLFVLSRSVGALAHAWEESQSRQRNKGPIPRHLLWNYHGPKARALKIKTNDARQTRTANDRKIIRHSGANRNPGYRKGK
jgi:citrate synthase